MENNFQVVIIITIDVGPRFFIYIKSNLRSRGWKQTNCSKLRVGDDCHRKMQLVSIGSSDELFMERLEGVFLFKGVITEW